MPQDPQQIGDLARSYTEAWCSRDPARVASHYVPGGTIAINGGEPARIAEVAASFIAAFPDIDGLYDHVYGDPEWREQFARMRAGAPFGERGEERSWQT